MSANWLPSFLSEPEDLLAIAAEQRREIMAARALDSDLDLAFDLQLQEAINASLALQPQPSAAAPQPQTQPSPTNDDVPKVTDLFSDELLKLELELKDLRISELEFRRLKEDLHRRIHDHQVALEISRMPEEEWEDWGGDFERPFGEGSSNGGNDEIFRVYFKGLVERASPKEGLLGGIGVAICDSRDGLLFELRKPMVCNSSSRRRAEARAMIEAFNCALELQLKRIVIYTDYHPIFMFVTGQWTSKQKKLSALLDQLTNLQKKFTYCQPLVVARNNIKFAFKLAREAIVSQANKAAESSGSRESLETCVICLEDTDIGQIFSVDGCEHRYCFSCMKQHVEVKLLHGLLPMCPHEACKTELKIDSCSKFLTPRLIEIMKQRIKEASIPVADKIYCPYPKCSALMSKNEALDYSKRAIVGAERSGARNCIKCNSRFCVNCKVPWHNNMTCFEYKRKNPFPQMEEVKLKNLAATNLWRQCVKCNHMIELAAGCYHMTCRCGYEFCYTCGAAWKNKKATCSCPLWDEDYIIEEDEFDEDEDEEEEEEEEYDRSYYDSDSDDYFL